jgi:hypothetical protein
MRLGLGLGLIAGRSSASAPATATNLLSYSEDLTNAAWGKTSVSITADAANAPTGAATADRIDESSSASIFQRATLASVTAFTAHTVSVHLKRVNVDWVRLLVGDSSGATNGFSVWFNLATGTKGSSAARGAGWPITAYDIVPAADGWWRVYVTFTPQFTAVNLGYTSASADAAGTRADIGSGAGVGTQTLWWGSMLETGSSMSAYVARSA